MNSQQPERPSTESIELPPLGSYTFEFDVAKLHTYADNLVIEDDEGNLYGEYGFEAPEDGPINILQVWLFDRLAHMTTAHMVTYPATMDMDKIKSRFYIAPGDAVVLASDGVGFEIDSHQLYLAGRIASVEHQPDGSFAKAKVEVVISLRQPEETA